MANVSTEASLIHVGHRFNRLEVDVRTDEELIGIFLSQRPSEAEEAFKTLVVRHGPMVLGVCRHVLGKAHDAEDSFQAVFLVLARKAGTIRDRRLVASWLYEVAYRISVRARIEAVRRKSHESQVPSAAADSPDPQEEFDNNDAWNELRSVLQSEVDRLPEKYRTPVILCYLEGKTNAEAATILNWPIGSVKGRLSRARDILHSRLMRRNLVLSATFLLSAIHRETVFAEVVPSRLVESTVKSARRISSTTTTKSLNSPQAEAALVSPSPEAFVQMNHYLSQRTRIQGRKLVATTAAVALILAILGFARWQGHGGPFGSVSMSLGKLMGLVGSTGTTDSGEIIRSPSTRGISTASSACH